MTETQILNQEDYYEVCKVLTDLPFNTSLVGYKMLQDAVVIILQTNKQSLNLKNDVYLKIANKYNCTLSCAEKAISNVITSASINCINCNYVSYPNFVVKNALLDAKPKAFMYSICELIKINRYYKQKSIK